MPVNEGCERLKLYVVSDVHLNNHSFDPDADTENPRRRHFRLFLSQINQTRRSQDHVALILNGDILDITGSWFDEVMPWDHDRQAVVPILNRLLVEILENNQAISQELRTFIRHPHSEIIYLFGNHDGLLADYGEAHETIRSFLALHPPDGARIRFQAVYVSPALGLHIEHGHLLDPFNHAPAFSPADLADLGGLLHRREKKNASVGRRQGKASLSEPPLGDVINVLAVNRFVELVVERMLRSGYPDAFVQRIRPHLHDIEYLRPLSLLPVWVHDLAKRYASHPENINKSESIQSILIHTISDILENPQMRRYAVERLKIPRSILGFIVKMILRFPSILPLVSFFTSKVIRRTHSNKYQYRAAQRLQEKHGYRLVAYGHTHIPAVLPLSEDAYYFNTGSWKPVINLFKHSKDPVELEYLSPEVQFNKVERCGILRIEKNLLNPAEPVEFSLQTIQSGLS